MMIVQLTLIQIESIIPFSDKKVVKGYVEIMWIRRWVWRQRLCINRCIVHFDNYRTERGLINQTVRIWLSIIPPQYLIIP